MDQTAHTFLLLDDRFVGERENLRLELGRVEKSPRNPLFVEEFFADPPRRWEARYDNLYPNVIYDDREGLFRLWYNAFIRAGQSEETPLAERPHTPYHGGKTAVMTTGTHGAHGTGVLEDPADPDPERRFKALFKNPVTRRMETAYSADGLRWSEPIPWAEHNAVGDTHNLAIRDPDGRYVGITRSWTGRAIDDGVRIAMRTESRDFVHWTDPVPVLQGRDAHDQIYSMPVFRVGPTYLGLPAIFHKGDPEAPDWDTVDTELAWSPDSVRWHRAVQGTPFIPRGEGSYPDGAHDCGCVYAAAPALVGDTHYLYYGGSNGQHNNFREGSFNLATVPRDRFAGYAAQDGGRLTTAPFSWGAGGVTVNAEVAGGGSLRFAILDEAGRTVDGFGLDDCDPIAKGGLDVAVRWGRSPSELDGRRVQLVFELHEVTLYALSGPLRFAEEPA
jgi:hypothetical protein